ncbi:O-methyltransferase-domain-containing protein [Collybia nuda]|uniref:O-methyltransferase-domain-containing protein n=1 Tax=Collybia nuda TaxID=64659 RepID=A0A9P6CNG5_9AGAR|nr:O-methyltransferase-domain-containing protein [Collybia nuda]
MASSPETTLARLSELLDIVDATSKSLRGFLQAEQRRKTEPSESNKSFSQSVADDLKLPFHADTKISGQAALLCLACERIKQAVASPRHIVFEAATSFWTATALKIAVESDVASLILKISEETGKEGVHVDILSRYAKVEEDFLARLLRQLSTSGIFQEISPLVFSNTISSLTLVSKEFRSHLGIGLYAGMNAAAVLPEYLSQRFALAASADASGRAAEYPPELLAPFNLVSKGKPFFQWLQLPENAAYAENFNIGMRGHGVVEGLAFLAVDYPFVSLPADTLIVDVGGGIGAAEDLILPSAPHLRFVIQDLKSVVEQGVNDAGPNMKRWIDEGRVRFQAQDFYAPQPREVEGAIFFAKSVFHNNPDSQVLRVLINIRQAKPSKLLVLDRLVIPHLRIESSTAAGESEIYQKLRAGVKLSGENGSDGDAEIVSSSQRITTTYDLYMGGFFAAKARTLDEWRTLLLQGGFRLTRLYPLRASTGQAIMEANPV